MTAFQKITLTGIEVLVMCCVVALSCQIVSKAPHYWQPAFRQQIACRTHAVFGPQCVAILACRNATHAKPPDQSCPSLVFDHQASLLFAPCLHGLLVLSRFSDSSTSHKFYSCVFKGGGCSSGITCILKASKSLTRSSAETPRRKEM